MLGYTITCVWKSLSEGMRHLNKCSFDWCRSSNLSSRLCTLNMIFFACSLSISDHINSPLLFVLYRLLVFESWSKETSFWLSLVVETGKTYPGIAAYSTFQNRNRRGQCKVLLPLIKKPHLEKTQKHISSHCLTNLFMFNETKESKN